MRSGVSNKSTLISKKNAFTSMHWLEEKRNFFLFGLGGGKKKMLQYAEGGKEVLFYLSILRFYEIYVQNRQI